MKYGDSKALRIHAKEKFPIDSKTHLQVQGELDTRTGVPNNFCAMIRHSYHDLFTSLGVGMRYDKRDKVRYTLRGKKSFLVTNDDSVNFVIKGRYDVDQEFKGRKSEGAAEFIYKIFNFQKDQDVRLKVGYEVFEQLMKFFRSISRISSPFHDKRVGVVVSDSLNIFIVSSFVQSHQLRCGYIRISRNKGTGTANDCPVTDGGVDSFPFKSGECITTKKFYLEPISLTVKVEGVNKKPS
ncbi:hypothetical protein GOBAR_DD28295 [Gossypium barbadense]|nr:hypothetical protein GOBAR_DD28295 [Gossypium barbadense]